MGSHWVGSLLGPNSDLLELECSAEGSVGEGMEGLHSSLIGMEQEVGLQKTLFPCYLESKRYQQVNWQAGTAGRSRREVSQGGLAGRSCTEVSQGGLGKRSRREARGTMDASVR